MQYRKLGYTETEVSLICLGTMTFGDQNTESEAFEQLDYALEQGVNFIDTAELYPVPPKEHTYSKTETILGNWFQKSGQREKVILATKCAGPSAGFTWIRGGNTNFDAKTLFEACNHSLRRLQTEYIDLYQLHWPTRRTNFFGRLGYEHLTPDIYPLEKTLEAIHQLILSGKIKNWGLSNETPWGLMTYLQKAKEMGVPLPVSIQNPYSLLNRTYEVGLAEISHRENIGLLAYSPLGFGVLSGKYLKGQKPAGSRLDRWSGHFGRYSSDLSTSATAKYAKLAEKWGLTPTQLALAFVNTRGFLTSTIIGATNLEQLQENIATCDLILNTEKIESINQIHTQIPNPAP